MSRKLTIVILFMLPIVQIHGQGIWTARASIPVFLEDAFSFTLQGNGYIGTGNQTGTGISKTFWKYNPTTNTWTQMANFGGVPRRNASAIAFSTYAYAGLGAGASGNSLFDWWQYDAGTNIWTQKNSISASPREGAPAATIGTDGYVFSGKMSTAFIGNTFKYQSQTDTWVIASLTPWSPRYDGVAVAFNQSIYFGLGYDGGGIYNYDWWKYNPVNGTWIQMSNFPGGGRKSAVAFEMNGAIYAGSGEDQFNNCTDDFYSYNVSSNTWSLCNALPGPSRKGACVFSTGNAAYLTTGIDNNSTLLNDTWKFEDATPIDNLESNQILIYFINQTELKIEIQERLLTNAEHAVELKLYNTNGQIVLTKKLNSKNSTLDVGFLKIGIYIVKVGDKKTCYSQKIFKN